MNHDSNCCIWHCGLADICVVSFVESGNVSHEVFGAIFLPKRSPRLICMQFMIQGPFNSYPDIRQQHGHLIHHKDPKLYNLAGLLEKDALNPLLLESASSLARRVRSVQF